MEVRCSLCKQNISIPKLICQGCSQKWYCSKKCRRRYILYRFHWLRCPYGNIDPIDI